MTKDVVITRGFASVAEAVKSMKEKRFAQAKIRRTPVIKNGLLGIISISDILRKSDFIKKPKAHFDLYCEENSNAPEARTYED